MARHDIFAVEDLHEKIVQLCIDYCNANGYSPDEEIAVRLNIEDLNASLKKGAWDKERTTSSLRLIHDGDGCNR